MLIGGAKAIDKFKAMKFNFENDRLDYGLCSGLTAILIMEAIGMNMGSKNKDIVSKDLEANKDDIIATYNKFKDKIKLPKDFIIKENGGTKSISAEEAGQYNTITGDIGPETVILSTTKRTDYTTSIFNFHTIVNSLKNFFFYNLK